MVSVKHYTSTEYFSFPDASTFAVIAIIEELIFFYDF